MPTSTLTNAASIARLKSLAAAHATRLPPLVSAVLVLVLAWLAGGLVWRMAPTPRAAHWTTAPLPRAIGITRGAATATLPASVEDLFGAPPTSALPGQSTNVHALATAPETHLDLKLLGILANRSTPGLSRALIAPGSGGDQPYALGQAVTPGVLLKAIFPDRVVLSRSGKLETLRLDLSKPPAGASSDVPIAVAGQQTGDALKMSAIRTQLLTNPGAAGQYIRVQPVNAPGGGQMGYRIYPGPNREAFKATGLHPGDIVTAINGVPLNNPAQTLQLLSELSKAQQVSVSVKRGTQTLTTTLDFGR
ncbi:MAG: PDZ domain-containing protein [Nevskiaceae bacterium]|nr:MAG: PDZ domain-containing protein [Nevskiaceae bacterium]TBR73332.1 MAG: PDZ domain-containing protein [Nevskiaceae bacterium]